MLATQLISALALVGTAFSHSIIRSSTNLTTCTPHPVSSAQQHEIFKALAKSWYTERSLIGGQFNSNDSRAYFSPTETSPKPLPTSPRTRFSTTHSYLMALFQHSTL
jgi:hypothetical protein